MTVVGVQETFLNDRFRGRGRLRQLAKIILDWLRASVRQAEVFVAKPIKRRQSSEAFISPQEMNAFDNGGE